MLAPILCILLAGLCLAEIPLITVEETLTFGQCTNTSDCTYYAVEYPSINVSDIFCNAQTSRCTLLDGTILTPTFQTPCTGLQLSTISYPAIICNGNPDGMIMVTLAPPPAEPTFIHGVLRLFLRAGYVNGTALDVPYLQEIFVNAPVTQYIFRGVAPGIYAIQYFHEAGCFVVAFPATIIDVFGVSGYMPNAGVSCDPVSDYLVWPYVSTTPDSFAFGVGIRSGIPSSFPLAALHTQIPADVGAGQRVPYAHVLDLQGGILATLSSEQLLLSGLVAAASTGGATFPLLAQNITSVIPTQLQAMTLAGLVSIQYGIGYAYRATVSSSVVFVQDSDGDYEGMRLAPILRNVSQAQFMNGTIDAYDVAPMHFTLNSIFTNTQFMYSDSNIFPDQSLLRTEPRIVVGPSGINSLCTSTTSSSIDIEFDYTLLLFPANPIALQIFRVVFNPGLAGTTLVADSPPVPIPALAGVYTLTVTANGFYCAVLSANILDSRGNRPLLWSCFQVGLATASITQTRSRYLQRGELASPYPYTPYAGYGTLVRTSFYVTLPVTLVIHQTQTIVLQLFVLSNSTLDMEQIEQFGGAVVAVFNDNQGDVPLGRYYDVEPLSGGYARYRLRVNVFSGNEFVVDRNGASSIVNSYAFTKLFIIDVNATTLTDYLGDYATAPGDANGDGGTNLTNADVLYECRTATYVNMIEALDMRARIDVDPAICPDQFSAMFAVADGGFPFHMANSNYGITSLPPGVRFPFADPVTYYFKWTVVSTGQVSYAGVGAYLFPAPSNQLISVEVIDAMGNVQQTYARAESLIPPGATVVSFLDQVPFCIGGEIQAVRLEYTVNRPIDATVIAFWAPLDPTARDNYDPNIQFFDLPANCSLLGTLSAYQVYVACQQNGGIANFTGNCTGCTRLPIQYPQAFGQTLITAVDSEWWEVIVWTQTTVFDFETGRFVWCRTGRSISSFIAAPLALTFSQPVFISPPPSQILCPSRACFSVTIGTVIDPRFGDYIYSQTILSAPSLPLITPPSANTYMVAFGVDYNLTVFIGNNFCPVSVEYTPSSTGPIITLIRTTRTNCASADGSVVIYAKYNNPDLSAAGSVANLCLYWPNRHDPSQAATDSIPMPFQLPVNARPTALPNNNFPETQRFAGIRGGPQQLLIYEACGGVTSTSGDCTSCLNAPQFTVTTGRRSVYNEFVIENFADPAGGLLVERTGYVPALCCGDNYVFNFTFRDNAATANQRYSVEFFLPFNLGAFQSWSQCTGPQTLPPPSPVGDFQVEWTGFDVVVPTCGIQGLGFSGNYTFVVRGCTSGCVSTYATYIDAVNPFLITLSTAGTSCAYSEAQLVPSVIGGAPYQPYDNFTLVYAYPGSSILYFAPYQYCWRTPFNPLVWDCTFLQLDVIPGFYQFKACDRNQCCGYSNITVGSAPPIDVSIVGYDKVCETSNQSTILFNVTGGVPPYYVLENITTVTTNDTISATFVATFNQTACFNILDSSGCVRPTEVCFRVPDPGPVNLTVVVEDSCRTVATGSVTVTSNQPITCSYLANNATIPVIQTCTLVNLPASAFITVTATTIIGCTGTESFQIGTRAPIVLTLVSRTTAGVLDGPCIDNITIAISGGDEPPPYIVALFDDMTNATLNYDGNQTIFITGVCRNFLYTVVAREGDGSCPVATVVNDPQFNFGSGDTLGLVGLPPPNPAYFAPLPDGPIHKRTHLRWAVAIVLLLGLLLVFAGLVYMFVLSRIEKRGGAEDTPKPVVRTSARLAAKRK